MASAVNINIPQGITLGVYNVPAATVNADQTISTALVNKPAAIIPVTQASIVAVVSGGISNPRVKAWTYTLDGHDYYILKLGTDGKTLVYDLSTKTWSWWSSGTTDRWRVSTGMNWYSSGTIPFQYGSNVIVGDDSSGILWVLDPEYGLDDPVISSNGAQTFPRVATGQIPTDGREKPPVYQVYLTASLGKPALADNYVQLKYSDDQGNSYVNAATKVCRIGDYDQEFAWRSLGLAGSKKSFGSPGRLFKIVDNGAFARIDSLEVI